MLLPEPGTVIDGKYDVVKQLGSGAMGVVYEVRHIRLGQHYAVKVVRPEMLATVDLLKRFEREARAAARLRSVHVARVIDVANTPEGLPYMVMELLEGQDLESVRVTRGRLPHAEVVDYVLQACAAIGEAHAAGIVHRDLKPANLFLARTDDAEVVKVLDFGISKCLEDDAKLTAAHDSVGTPLYMSPEQIRSSAVVDARTDIWSLGVMLYELISGEPPWRGTTPQVIAGIVSDDTTPLHEVTDIPAALSAVVARMLEKQRDDRYATVADVAAALTPFCRPGGLGQAAARALAKRSDSTKDLLASTEPPPAPRADPIPEDAGSAATLHQLVPPYVEVPSTETSFAAQPARAHPTRGIVLVAVAAVVVLGAGGAMLARSRSPSVEPSPSPSVEPSLPGAPHVVDTASAATSAPPPPPAIEPPPPASAPTATASARAKATASAKGGPAHPAPAKPAPPASKNPTFLIGE